MLYTLGIWGRLCQWSGRHVRYEHLECLIRKIEQFAGDSGEPLGRRDTMNFMFIDHNDEESRRVALAHAIRTGLSSKKRQTRFSPVQRIHRPLPWRKVTSVPTSSCAGSSVRITHDPGTSQLESEGQGQGLYAPNNIPQTLLGAGRTDPFKSYPTGVTKGRIDMLVDFLINDMATMVLDIKPKTALFNPYKRLFRLVLQDPASWHAILCSITVAWSKAHGAKTTSEESYHKMNAVRHISEHIRGNKRPSESAIVAVILLWSHESLFSIAEALHAHLDGMQRMIVMRGGVLSLSGPVQLLLAWTIIILPGIFRASLPHGPQFIESIAPRDEVQYLAMMEACYYLQDLHTLALSGVFTVHAKFFRKDGPIYHLLGVEEGKILDFMKAPDLFASVCRLACLFCLCGIVREYASNLMQLLSELNKLKLRLEKYELAYGQCTSTVMLSECLMIQEDRAEVHDRWWPVVRIMNVVKMWNVPRQADLSRCLYSYLSDDHTKEEEQEDYDRILGQIKRDIEVLHGPQ